MAKIFYKNGLRKSDQIEVLEKSIECTKKILEAKKNKNTEKMTTKFQDSNTALKTYGTKLNRRLHKKRSLLYHLYLLMVVSFQTTGKKQIFLITFLFLYVHLLKQ